MTTFRFAALSLGIAGAVEFFNGHPVKASVFVGCAFVLGYIAWRKSLAA